VERVGEIVADIEISVGLVQGLNVRECHGFRISVTRWREAAQRIADSVRKMGGIPEAADRIERFVAGVQSRRSDNRNYIIFMLQLIET
jgi:hypothetical protein